MGTTTVADWLRDARVRRTAGSPRPLLRAVVNLVEILPSKAKRAYTHLEVAIAPDDRSRLVHDGVPSQFEQDAAPTRTTV